MIPRLLCLHPGELRRLTPFFGLYLLLFAALTIADGLSLALFVQQVGAANLPAYYALTGVANLLLIGAYILTAERAGGRRVFQVIIGGSMSAYATAWAAVTWFDGGDGWYGLLFVGREVSYTLVLMHFGTYLQDFFSREELNRVIPIIYAGGRVGGIAGGRILETLSAPLGLLNLVPVFLGLGLVCMLLLWAISSRCLRVDAPADQRGDPGVVPPRTGGGPCPETLALTSLGGFLRFAWASPLLFWTTVMSVIYIGCRWILNFQYNSFFEGHFASDVAMAEFLGRYTQIALALSLVLQLLVVNRLIAWIGIKGTYFLYAVLLLTGLGLNILPMTIGMAIFSRFLETELRFGLRNPVSQLITNKFSKPLRIRVRAWSLGVLIPISTLSVSVVLSSLLKLQAAAWIPWLGGFAGLAYFLGAFGLCRSFTEKPKSRSQPTEEETIPTAVPGQDESPSQYAPSEVR